MKNFHSGFFKKGTGKWTGIAALEYGVPVTLIGE
jgi:6-phosphogluconate dehydrogenase